MRAIDIMWDIDDDFEGNPLPTEVEIPNEYATDPAMLADRDLLEETISDWLSDTYDMCHEGFRIEYTSMNSTESGLVLDTLTQRNRQ